MTIKSIELTHEEAIELNKGLTDVGGIKSSPKFSLELAKNRYALKPTIKGLADAKEPSNEFLEFQEANNTLVKKHGEVMPGSESMFVPSEKMTEFKIEQDELEEKHKKAIDARRAQLKEYNKLLSTKVEPSLKFSMFKDGDLPKTLNGNQKFGIIQLIN